MLSQWILQRVSIANERKTSMKRRLDGELVTKRLAITRSQAENLIRLGKVTVNKKIITKPGHFVSDRDSIEIAEVERYVSRAGLKLASVAELLRVSFQDKIVLDVGSSTGGFTDYALQHGAKKVIAVDVGTDQLHPSLRNDSRIKLHEKTDIRDFSTEEPIDVVVVDVSFISLRMVLPHIASSLSQEHTEIIAMLKPQFEAGKDQTNKGVIKNEAIRRRILKDFEEWTRHFFVIVSKRDSAVTGVNGNQERFYVLKKIIS